jgi:hypothetical protein
MTQVHTRRDVWKLDEWDPILSNFALEGQHFYCSSRTTRYLACPSMGASSYFSDFFVIELTSTRLKA